MRIWTYLLVIAGMLLLPAGAMAGVFGTTETSSVLQTPSQTIAPPPTGTPVATPKAGFAELPAIAPGAPVVEVAPTTVATTTTLLTTTVPTTLATTSTEPATTTTTTTTTTLPAPSPPSVAWQLAHLRAGGADIFATPDATVAPVLHLDAQTEWGAPRIIPVLERSVDWLKIPLPIRPNDATGWIRADGVDLTVLNDEIHVSLDARAMELVHDTAAELTVPVSVGAPTSPTPPGVYYVTDILATSGSYGPFALALNGHSETYQQFNGGDARLGIHGTDEPGSIGRAASHGCVRVANDVVTVLAQRVQIGTPVIIS
jgi:hypothetical protein